MTAYPQRAGRVLLGAAIALLVLGVQDQAFGPGEVSAWPVVGLALGCALGVRFRASPRLLPVAFLVCVLLPTAPLPVWLAGPGIALGPALAGAGATARLGGGLSGAARTALGASAGLAAGTLLPGPSASTSAWWVWVVSSGLCLLGAWSWTRAPRREAGSTPGVPALQASLVGVRVVVSVAAGAAVLSFLGPRGFLPAAAVVALGLAAGLIVSTLLPDRQRARLLWGTEPIGWVLLAVLLDSTPTQTPEFARVLLALVGLSGGLGLGGPLARGGAPGLVLGVIGLALAPPLLARAPSHWTAAEAAGAALGLGSEPDARDQLATSLEEGTTSLRLTVVGPPTVQVVDVLAQRLLARDGRPWSGIPTRRSGEWAYATPELLQAVVPLLVGKPEPAEQRAAAVALGTGVVAGTLLACGAEVTAIEGDPGALAVLRDAGELFGLANGRLFARDAVWERLLLVEAPCWPALRAGRWDLIALGRPDPAPGVLRLAGRRGGVVAARLAPPTDSETAPRGGRSLSLRSRVAVFLGEFPQAYAFWPGDEIGALVLVGGLQPLDLARAQARWPAIAPAVVHARGPLVSWARALGTCVADGAGLRRFVDGDADDDLGGLTASGAEPPPQTTLPSDSLAASLLLTALAEGAAVRKLPAARGWAAQAAALDRTVHTVRLLGDLIYREGDADRAIALWREALQIDPSALGPRLSLVSLFLNRSQPDAARQLLTEGLSQTPDAPPLHYALGELAEREGEPLLAARHFQAAGSFRDAPLRVRRAASQVRDIDHSLDLSQKVEAAALLFDRARASDDADEAPRLRQEVLELALSASNATESEEPGAEVRATLARVLAGLAEGEEFELARKNLYAHQARVLGPLTARVHLLSRVRALLGAGQPEVAERISSELIRQDPSDSAAHLAKGDALVALGEGQAAIGAYQRGLGCKEPSSSDAWIHESLARLHVEAHQPELALAALDEAVRLAPGHVRLLFARAQLLLELERPRDALTALRAFLQAAHPSDPARPEVERQVRALEDELR